MKKVLISALIILLIIAAYFIIGQGVSIAGWDSKSINRIKDFNNNLNERINTATEKKQQTYPEKIEKLEASIKSLQTTKEKYDNKLKYVSENVELGLTTVKEYKIERLWIALENYAQKENVDLLLNVVESGNNTYNLEVAVVGEYINITDFIYDIEKDDTLGFKIENFEMHQYRVKTTIKTTGTSSDVIEEPLDGTSAAFKGTQETDTSAEGIDVVGEATDGLITVDPPTGEKTISYDPKFLEAKFIIKNVQIDNTNGKFN